MTEQQRFTVKKHSYVQTVELLGLDDQGRQTYRCPSVGCGEVAWLDEDGRGHCPFEEAVQTFLTEKLGTLADHLFDASRSAYLSEGL